MLTDELRHFLQKDFAQNNRVDPLACQEKYIQYLDLLSRWSRVHNLTTIQAPDAMVQLHLLDSLSIQDYLHGSRILDVGTGAGLPGIPLAIACPDKHFTLLDSNTKKTRFLLQVVYELGLKNVEVVHARCEDFRSEQGFDSILSRAFATIRLMLESTHHLLAFKGQFLAMKGRNPEAELIELPTAVTVLGVHELTIKGLDAKRHLVRLGMNAPWEK